MSGGGMGRWFAARLRGASNQHASVVATAASLPTGAPGPLPRPLPPLPPVPAPPLPAEEQQLAMVAGALQVGGEDCGAAGGRRARV